MKNRTAIKLFEQKQVRTVWNETVTICNRLKVPAQDGKMRLTDTEQLLYLIHSQKNRTIN